jgi:hypothetical protein
MMERFQRSQSAPSAPANNKLSKSRRQFTRELKMVKFATTAVFQKEKAETTDKQE